MTAECHITGDATGTDQLLRVSTPTQFALCWQRLVGRVLLIPLYELIALQFRRQGYQINNVEQVRRIYQNVVERSKRNGIPLIVCANHLTLIDSCLMIWAFGSSTWYFRNYRALSWNLPAGDFFKKRFLFRVVAYIGKCVFIHRDSGQEHKTAILELCRKLVNRGDVLTIFPEGRRSRTGRFDVERMTYGVGKIVSGTQGCEVLCVYLRANGQDTFTDYPAKGSTFDLRARLIKPTVTQKSKRAYFEVLQQIGDTILQLETEHFH